MTGSRQSSIYYRQWSRRCVYSSPGCDDALPVWHADTLRLLYLLIYGIILWSISWNLRIHNFSILHHKMTEEDCHIFTKTFCLCVFFLRCLYCIMSFLHLWLYGAMNLELIAFGCQIIDKHEKYWINIASLWISTAHHKMKMFHCHKQFPEEYKAVSFNGWFPMLSAEQLRNNNFYWGRNAQWLR